MKTFKVQFHSFVDIITNSSTEIYTNPTNKAVDSMYEILGKFLKIGGVDTDPRAKKLVKRDSWKIQVTVWAKELFDLSKELWGNTVKKIRDIVKDMLHF